MTEQRTDSEYRKAAVRGPQYMALEAKYEYGLEAAVKLRRVVATEFEVCVAMRANIADVVMGCYQCVKWEGEGCEEDAVLDLLAETAFLADSPEAAVDGETTEEGES